MATASQVRTKAKAIFSAQYNYPRLESLIRDVTDFLREEGYTRVIRQIRKRMKDLRER